MTQTCLGRTPFLVHFDEELQEDLLAEESLDISSRLRPDALECRTGLADDNTFLTVALHIDNCRDTDDMLLFFELLHLHFDGVRNLLLVIKQYLLTNDLIHKEP